MLNREYRLDYAMRKAERKHGLTDGMKFRRNSHKRTDSVDIDRSSIMTRGSVTTNYSLYRNSVVSTPPDSPYLGSKPRTYSTSGPIIDLNKVNVETKGFKRRLSELSNRNYRQQALIHTDINQQALIHTDINQLQVARSSLQVKRSESDNTMIIPKANTSKEREVRSLSQSDFDKYCYCSLRHFLEDFKSQNKEENGEVFDDDVDHSHSSNSLRESIVSTSRELPKTSIDLIQKYSARNDSESQILEKRRDKSQRSFISIISEKISSIKKKIK